MTRRAVSCGSTSASVVLDPDCAAKVDWIRRSTGPLARRFAAEGMVLLKNDRSLLPLDPAKVRRVLVTGPGAEAVPFGRGSSAVQSSVRVTPLQGLTAALGDGVKITHLAWRDGHVAAGQPASTRAPRRNKPGRLPRRFKAAARTNDVVLFFATDPVHGESTDLKSFDLPGGQAEAIAGLAAANPKVAVVLMTAEPLSLEPWADQVPAILAAWYGGQATGGAIADVLTGKVLPPESSVPLSAKARRLSLPCAESLAAAPGC